MALFLPGQRVMDSDGFLARRHQQVPPRHATIRRADRSHLGAYLVVEMDHSSGNTGAAGSWW